MQPSHLGIMEFSLTGGDTLKTARIGGKVIRMTSPSALLIGDCVYVSADNSVDKSAVAGTFGDKLLGVVIGGDKFDGGLLETYGSASVGLTASTAAGWVLVMYTGIAYVTADGIIAAGAPISASIGTAGRVTSSNTNARVIGKLLVAAGANGDVRLALIGWA